MNSILVLGSGSREHSIAKKLAESRYVKNIFVAPGNGGTEKSGNAKILNLKIDITRNEVIKDWCLKNQPNLVIIGPEDTLNNGIVNLLLEQNLNIFGPTKSAARIECDKGFSKDFMKRHNIPTANYKIFNKSEDALNFLDNPTFENPFVIKATGLALGKGVIVTKSIEEAKKEVIEILINKKFGSSGESIIIEEFLEGDEFSILAFTDGDTVTLLPPSQDHKRAYFKDQGPNTGGMGAICPFPLINEQQLEEIKKNIIQKTIDGLKSENAKFVGILFAGLILCKNNSIKVLEFNCRFGDPETQTILPLLETDLFELILSCTKGYKKKNDLTQSIPDLNKINLKIKKANSISVVIASGGYPQSSTKHQLILNLNEINKYSNEKIDYQIYHAATYVENGNFYTNGGRVLSIVAISEIDLEKLISKIQNCIKNTIDIENFFYRTDIGEKTVKKLQKQKLIF